MSFDHLAPHYDWLESLTAGARLQRARTAWLPALEGCRRILSVGEGHGRFAGACASAYQDTELTCVEASPAMLARAQRRQQGRPARIRWQQSDIFSWQPDGSYDAIVTCFFLDCFAPDELQRVVDKLAGCASARAKWIVADFAIPASGLARRRAQLVHALMYGFFRRVARLSARHVTPPDSLLRAAGFSLEARKQWEWGLIRADLWQRG
jgi:ubiquinone/menaquinone biosynthesis C-methylase UbiE